MSNKLGDFIQGMRATRNLSIRALARMCDISPTHLDTIEKGYDFRTGKKVSVTLLTLEKLASGLGVDAEDLFALSINRNPRNKRNIDYLTDAEREIIYKFRKASPDVQKIIFRILKGD